MGYSLDSHDRFSSGDNRRLRLRDHGNWLPSATLQRRWSNATSGRQSIWLACQVDLRQINELPGPPIEDSFEHEQPKFMRLIEGRGRRHDQLLTRADDIEKRRSVMLEHFLNCGWKVLGRLDANALDTHGLGHCGEIRIGQITPGIEEAGRLHFQFYKSQSPVVQDDDLHW